MQALFLKPLPAWKRALDIVGAATALILLSPLLIAVAVVIKITSPGPVIFRQLRHTLGGRPFMMYKFRTMTADAEQQKAALRPLSEQDGPAFKIADDPRVTRLGRFLRSTSIDELPQLVNVLKGEITLVGPRPLPCDESHGCERLATAPAGRHARADLHLAGAGTFQRYVCRMDADGPAIHSIAYSGPRSEASRGNRAGGCHRTRCPVGTSSLGRAVVKHSHQNIEICNMSVAIITGSAGLIGSEATRYFAGQGMQVVGVDNDMRRRFFGAEASTARQANRLQQELGDQYQHVEADIRDDEAIDRLFRLYGREISLVVHTAAQPSHDWAAREPKTDFGVNALGTLNLLEATRQFAPEAVFIFTSTNKVYGDTPNRLPLVELETRWEIEPDHVYAPGISESMSIDHTLHSVFGASKVAADVMVQEYGRYFGMKTACFRGGCLTGPSHSGTREKAAAVLNADQKEMLDAMPQSPQTMRDMHEQMTRQLQKMMGPKDARAVDELSRHADDAGPNRAHHAARGHNAVGSRRA